jgi:hypothetical protein
MRPLGARRRSSLAAAILEVKSGGSVVGDGGVVRAAGEESNEW